MNDSYLVLARKYRPKNFEELAGQESIAVTLKNAVAQKRLAHAYLFYGPRGVGKTSTARLLAKALNCKGGPTPSPCSRCTSCEEIALGNSVDVLEMDAASHTGVDHVRDVIVDAVALAPARDRYRVFIIDEVHMLSNPAFNALLKTLEEPPAHVVFILATTESHRIPATILSRCQRFQFRPIPLPILLDQLSQVIHKEDFKVDEGAVRVLAESAQGSLRDALSVLDQAVAFSSGPVTLEFVRNLFGHLPQERLFSLLECLLRSDVPKVWRELEDLGSEGQDPGQLLRDLREAFRKLFLAASGIQVDLPPAWRTLLKEANAELFLWMLKRLSRALEEMRFAEQPRLVLELTLFALLQPPRDFRVLLDRLEALESRLSQAPQGKTSRPQELSQDVKSVVLCKNPQDSSEGQSLAEAKGSQQSQDVRLSAPLEEGELRRLWSRLVQAARQEKPALATYLESAGLSLSRNLAQCVLLFQSSFHLEGARRGQSWIESKARSLSESFPSLRFELAPASASSLGGEAAGLGRDAGGEEILGEGEVFEAGGMEAAEKGEASEEERVDPGIQKILDVFPGKLRREDSK